MTFELYFYERVGDRYYLRVTTFAIVLIVIAMAFGYTILWLDGRKQTAPDVKITVPSPTSYSLSAPLIKQAPPPPIPKAVRQPKANASMPLPPTLTTNNNEK
jgi:hypothetical protein